MKKVLVSFVFLQCITSAAFGQQTEPGFFDRMADGVSDFLQGTPTEPKGNVPQYSHWTGQNTGNYQPLRQKAGGTPPWQPQGMYYTTDIQANQQQIYAPAMQRHGIASANNYVNPYTGRELDNPVVACRRGGCTTLNDRITKEFLFNSLMHMFNNNENSKIYFCEADPRSRACIRDYIGYGANIGATPATVTIPEASLVDVRFNNNLDQMNVLLNYYVYVNGEQARCTSAYNSIHIKSDNYVLMEDNDYHCQMTASLPSTAFSMYRIDYVDIDYGIIGANYSIGLTGQSQGGGKGYVLMKFENNGHIGDTITNYSTFDSTVSMDRETGPDVAPGQYLVSPLDPKEEKPE